MADYEIEPDDTIDQKQKERIVSRREEVDEWEMELYTQATLGEIARQQADLLWGYRVRAFLKTVEPLLEHGGLTQHDQKIIASFDLGDVRIDPPEELVRAATSQRGSTGGIELLQDEDIGTKNVPIQGLRQVIERKICSASWTVQIRDPDAPGRRVERTYQQEKPVPYDILEDAVRLADEWLQLAGIGIAIDPEDWESEEPLTPEEI